MQEQHEETMSAIRHLTERIDHLALMDGVTARSSSQQWATSQKVKN